MHHSHSTKPLHQNNSSRKSHTSACDRPLDNQTGDVKLRVLRRDTKHMKASSPHGETKGRPSAKQYRGVYPCRQIQSYDPPQSLPLDADERDSRPIPQALGII